VAALIDDAAASDFTNLVNAIRELVAPVLDMNGRRMQREVAAIHIGNARHSEGRGRRTDAGR
jgi:hypothetical protein